MSPRPRATADAQLIEATTRAISRVGPARLTLADVAREAGVVPATLVQRFGSKRGLLLALARQGAGGVDECFRQARARHRSPLAAALAAMTSMADHVESPQALSNHLAFLQIDLTDPDFYRLTLEHARATQAGLRKLLDEAVRAGELRRSDTRRLARAIQAMVGGSMVAWAILREGSLKPWMRRDLKTLLERWRK